jgi:hypothetical protein
MHIQIYTYYSLVYLAHSSWLHQTHSVHKKQTREKDRFLSSTFIQLKNHLLHLSWLVVLFSPTLPPASSHHTSWFFFFVYCHYRCRSSLLIGGRVAYSRQTRNTHIIHTPIYLHEATPPPTRPPLAAINHQNSKILKYSDKIIYNDQNQHTKSPPKSDDDVHRVMGIKHHHHRYNCNNYNHMNSE